MTLKEYENAIKAYEKLSSNQPVIHLSQTSFLLDNNGQPFAEIYQNENRIYKKLKDIPQFFLDLVIVNEDQNFYQHKGIDLLAITRAALINAKSSDLKQGGSTITQQLAKNLYLTNEKTFERKWNEIIYTLSLEKNYSKDQLLELYINTIYFQHGIYGIESASQFYFQKHTEELSKAEMAFLAAIPNNPTLYDPLTNFDNTKKRQQQLLKNLLKVKKISKEEFNSIIHEPIRLNIKKRKYLYPDYADYVLKELKDLIQNQPGNEHLTDEQLEKELTKLLNSGVNIHTSLNRNIQKKAKASVQKHLQPLPIEGAVVIIQHEKNEISAIIGGKNYERQNFHRAYQAYRQPASAIKPILVFAPFLERYPEKMHSFVDASNICIQSYCPKNYGGYEYGKVTLREAFIYSLNTSAIRLLNEVGINNAFHDLKAFDFEKITKDDYRLPAAIGGFTYGLSPLELTKAYTVFSTKGIYKYPKAIKKVTDANGNTILEWNHKHVQVWNEQTIKIMRSFLHDTVINGTGRSAYFPTVVIGGKTGTSDDFKDLWFVGYTKNYTAGIWIGYDQPKSMDHLSNQAIHMQIWKEILQE